LKAKEITSKDPCLNAKHFCHELAKATNPFERRAKGGVELCSPLIGGFPGGLGKIFARRIVAKPAGLADERF
jgi:hypothetical protein